MAESKKYERNNATWCLKRRREMNRYEKVAQRDLLPLEMYKKGDEKYMRKGKIPVHPLWRAPAWIITHSLPPLFLQMTWYQLFPQVTWSPTFQGAVLVAYFFGYLLMLVRNLHYWMKEYGVFDYENCGRDLPRDNEVPGLARGVMFAVFARVISVLVVGNYDRTVPVSFGFRDAAITPQTLVKMFFWFLVLDLLFYIYHRACHEVPALWKVHAKHHATKHPTPLQATLAGNIQEVIEILLIPLIASLIIRMNTYELWLCLCTLIYVEALGHSGARVYWGHPLLHPVLDPLGLSLVIEDHDMHHRNGKSGRCYGKQSLVWDKRAC